MARTNCACALDDSSADTIRDIDPQGARAMGHRVWSYLLCLALPHVLIDPLARAQCQVDITVRIDPAPMSR